MLILAFCLCLPIILCLSAFANKANKSPVSQVFFLIIGNFIKTE